MAYAATPAVDRPRLRKHLFGTYWASGANLSDPETLTRLGAINEDEPTAAKWRDEWLTLPRTIVPIMVLPDGYVSRGLGALARLADLATTQARDEMPSNASAAAGAPTAPRTDQSPHPKTPPSCCDN